VIDWIGVGINQHFLVVLKHQGIQNRHDTSSCDSLKSQFKSSCKALNVQIGADVPLRNYSLNDLWKTICELQTY